MLKHISATFLLSMTFLSHAESCSNAEIKESSTAIYNFSDAAIEKLPAITPSESEYFAEVKVKMWDNPAKYKRIITSLGPIHDMGYGVSGCLATILTEGAV
ncbi:hypothetical protein PN836_014800 [Ningiella sp. W23]|uniref:hypothetical protein n=1 Tax=Ningiella sp. W23 TaxID=3023715 RepID=UPI003756602F